MNGYKFDFAVSATISPKVVEEMVKKVVEEQTGKKVNRIEMKMRTVSKGMMRDEYTETIFDGCTVYFENDPATNVKKDASGFVPDTYGR
jgi:uncharacterized surface anchored protein